MKKLFICLSLILLINLAPQFTFSQTGSITNYYYYNNSKTFLDLKHDHIYVKLNNELSKEQFINSTQVFSQYLNYDNFKSAEKNQVLKLSITFHESGISDLLNNLKSSGLFECVSPVFTAAGQKENSVQFIAANDEIIVQYKTDMSNNEIAEIEQSNDLTIVKALSLTGGKTIVYKVKSNSFSFDAANEIYESGKVNYAEPNFYITNLGQYVPNDPLFSQQWALRNTGNNIPEGISGTAGCDMRLDSAWNISLGSNKVKISVVDTGIDSLHEDLSGNLIPNSQYNFINESTNAFDDNGHGTACAGIIAATGNNSIGVSGVAPNSRLVAIKSLDANASGTYLDLAEGLIYAWQIGSWICSNSWGGGTGSSIIDNAILDGTTLGRNGKGTIYLFATGNSETNLIFPSNNPRTIAVGALSPCNQRKSLLSCDTETWWGSCYGTGLSIVAPGVKIFTTDISGNGGYTAGNYVSNFNGTSSATPNAAGVVALMLSIDSTLRWEKVREYLCRSADKVGNYNYNSEGPNSDLGYTWNNEMGYGKVNSYNAVRYTAGSQGFSFNHISLTNTDNLSGPYTITSSIVSVNGTIDASKTKVFWTRGNSFDSIPMTNSGGINWTANIPGNGSPGNYKYYIKAGDVTGISKTYPVLAPETYFSFKVLNDVTPPVILHTNFTFFPVQYWPAKIKSIVTDSVGIDSVWVRWNKNNSSLTKHFKLHLSGQNEFEAIFNSLNSEVSNGDSIFYKIYAQDNSSLHNRDSTDQYKMKTGYINLCQDYTSTIFPPDFWRVEYDNNLLWSRAIVSAFASGIGSATFKYYDAEPGVTQSMLTTPFDLSESGDSLKFNHAYATYQTEIDSLIIEVSSNAGASYTTLARLSGGVSGNLVTASPTQNPFTPAPNQWATKKYALPIGTDLIRFKAVSAYGNNLYLDNICKVNGTTGISNLNLDIPFEYSLSQNYPNPFNPTTKINFSIPVNGFVTLKIYDVLGKEVMTLVNEQKPAGNYATEFNGANLSSGVYFFRMEAGEFIDVKRMMLIK
ncbi:MAG: S8 family serine peptidase [Ignavibacteria bacterium]